MRTIAGLFAVVFLSLVAAGNATKIIPTDLKELVARADYILVGKVTKVDMVDARGHKVRDKKARTGPGLTNIIRLHFDVDKKNILKGKLQDVPQQLIVEDWPWWHQTLGEMKELHEGNNFIFLLKGKNFKPVSEPESVRPITERGDIEKILMKAR
jgi:hypothetical protein